MSMKYGGVVLAGLLWSSFRWLNASGAAEISVANRAREEIFGAIFP